MKTTPFLALLLLLAGTARALPAAQGDDVANPFPLEGATATDTRPIAGATPQNEFAGFPYTLWWRWTAPSNGIVAVTTREGSGAAQAIVAAYLSSSPGRLDAFLGQATNFPVATVKFQAAAGTTYQFVAGTRLASTVPVRLDLAYALLTGAPPANDYFRDRTLVTGTHAVLPVDTSLATGEPIDANKDLAGGHSVWWEWHAPDDGVLRLDTTGSGFDTVLGAYALDATHQRLLGQIAMDDDVTPLSALSQLTLYVAKGYAVAIAIDGHGGAAGKAVLNLDFVALADLRPPANGTPATATPIASDFAFLSSPDFGATNQWWKWTATHASRVQLFAGYTGNWGSLGSPKVTVWRAAGDGADPRPAAVATGQSTGLYFDAVPGVTYLVNVATPAGVTPLTYQVAFDATAPPANVTLAVRHVPATPTMSDLIVVTTSGAAIPSGVLQSSPDLVYWTDVRTRAWKPDDREIVYTAGDGFLAYRLAVP